MNLKRWKSPSASGPQVLDFHYPRLRSKNSIRLAKIKPGSWGKGIAIDLIESFLPIPGQQKPAEYDALSYTWGDGAQDKTISCNGRRLAVTQTLLEALRHFRDPDREVMLWIDQICICQQRISERNQQVQLMGKIFMGAKKVSVWLGEHYDDSKAGMQLAEQLLSICRHQHLRSLDAAHLESHGLPARGSRKWKALALVLRRPWFWRTWIVQEVVLNPNVELVLDKMSLKWEELEAIVNLLEGPAPLQWHVDLTMSAWDLPFSRINRIRLRHQKRAAPIIYGSVGDLNMETTRQIDADANIEHDLDLLDLLLISRDLGATDPRDKIYALLGLSSHEMIPDYEATPEHVFHEFALHVIGEVTRSSSTNTTENKLSSEAKEVRKALIMLSCAGRPNQSRDLPSWIPDWTSDLVSRPLVFDSRFAAGGSVMNLDWSHETGLQVCGRLVDTVAIAGSILLGSTADSRTLIEKWWQEAKAIANKRSVRSPGSTANFDAFKAMCRDLSLCEHGYYQGEPSGPSFGNSASNSQYPRRDNLLDEFEMDENAAHNAHQTLALGPTRGRVLFVTTTGYLGLAPYSTVEGDLAYVVLGASVPYILRPSPDGHFTLVGEAYIQGIMGGEILAMDQWSGVEDLHIR